MTLMAKNILIAHYRVGKTDGVSLEIAKRKQILTQMGHQVYLLSGPNQLGANFVIDEFEFDRPRIAKLWQNTINECRDYDSSEGLKKELFTVKEQIEQKLDRIFSSHEFDIIYVHNMLSMAINLAATIALVTVIKRYNLPCVAVHHDFYWEGAISTTPTFPFVEELIQTYLVPKLSLVKHITINTLNHEKLLRERGIEAQVNYDVFDFHQPQWKIDNYNHDFRKIIGLQENDIIVLQATRIVPNKTIEFAIEFVYQFQKLRQTFENTQLYNGKWFHTSNRIVLILSGYTETACTWYKERLQDLAKKRNVHTLFLEDIVRPVRKIQGDTKHFSFWDPYVFADLVTFPSIWEGWGNQFIETIFAKKPIVVFEYPVFKKDIASEEYQVISLGDRYTPAKDNGLCSLPSENLLKAMGKTIDILLDSEKYEEVVETNFCIGEKNHSYTTLRRYLHDTLTWADSF
jgi:glycosyltransferase involved in cell wall biosynthesis